MLLKVISRCYRMETGRVCRFRHLDADHPDAIADRFRNGLLSKEDIKKYNLRVCDAFESNPFAPQEAKICFEYLNHHVCSRNVAKRICRFRHLESEHPEAVKDRMKVLKESVCK